MEERKYIKIGVAFPDRLGKPVLNERLSRKWMKAYSIGVITNDIYTKEDAEFLTQGSLLHHKRVIGVETGGWPHMAICEDSSMSQEASDEIMSRFPEAEIISKESNSGNLSATFSLDLANATILVIDIAAGEKIPARWTRHHLFRFTHRQQNRPGPEYIGPLPGDGAGCKAHAQRSTVCVNKLMSLEGLDHEIGWI